MSDNSVERDPLPHGLRKAARIALAVMYSIVVVGSLLPAPMLPRLPTSDKVEHSTSYLLLALLSMLSFSRQKALAQAVMVAALLGGVLELLQGLTPTRTPDWLDFRANLFGIAIGLAIGLPVRWLVSRMGIRSLAGNGSARSGLQ